MGEVGPFLPSRSGASSPDVDVHGPPVGLPFRRARLDGLARRFDGVPVGGVVGHQGVPDVGLDVVEGRFGRLQRRRRAVMADGDHEDDVLEAVVFGGVGRDAADGRQVSDAVAGQRARRLPAERVELIQPGGHKYGRQGGGDFVDDGLSGDDGAVADGSHGFRPWR